MTGSRNAAAGGELMVSVGGTTLVATDVVLSQAELWRYVHGKSGHWHERVEQIRQLDLDGPLKFTAQDAGLPLLWAAVALGQLEEHSEELVSSLVEAAERYGQAERVAMQLAMLQSARFGHDLGRFPLLALLVTAGAVPRMALAEPAHQGTARGLRIDHRLLTNPSVVVMAKLIISSLDDVAAGALGVPFPIDLLLGDTGLGLVGVSSTAVAVLAVARSRGVFREGPVTATPVGAAAPSTPPTGVGDLAARIPKAVAGRSQVRIEQYGSAEHPSWAVYIGGTVDWGAVATSEPWDLTANVSAIAQENAGSFRAAMEAMRAAGIRPDDEVVVAGHSQGGLVATQVAAAETFNVRAVATFGSPESRVPVPPGVATLTVEHSDDIVTAAGGASLIDSADRVTVRREVFATGDPPSDTVLPAHHLDTYRETARIIDASPQEHLKGFQDAVTGILGSAPGAARSWRGIRLPEAPRPK